MDYSLNYGLFITDIHCHPLLSLFVASVCCCLLFVSAQRASRTPSEYPTTIKLLFSHQFHRMEVLPKASKAYGIDIDAE
jgi:hypothetical protein